MSKLQSGGEEKRIEPTKGKKRNSLHFTQPQFIYLATESVGKVSQNLFKPVHIF